jgi:hypothetical protein
MTIAQIDPLNLMSFFRLSATGRLRQAWSLNCTFTPPWMAPARQRWMPVDPVIDGKRYVRVRPAIPNQGNAIPAGVSCSVSLWRNGPAPWSGE